MDLNKLARLVELLKALEVSSLSLIEATAELEEIDKIPPAWGPWWIVLGYVFVGAGLAPVLGGGWWDTLLSSLLSILVFGVVITSGRLGSTAMAWMPLSTAFISSLLATVVKIFWLPELNLVLVTLSAIAIILPGYTISLGAGELVEQQVLSGMSNLMNGLFCLVKLIVGGWLGISFANAILPDTPSITAVPIAQLWLLIFFPILIVGLCLVFQTPPRDLFWVALVSNIAYLGVMAGSALVDSNMGNFIGTVIAVVIANLWARQTGRPSSIVLIPAVVMLVSGSIGFRGLAAMAGGELLLGAQQFFQMFVVALTITIGIVVGHSIVRPAATL
ncbi:threonine/serine ThrE exporter family protein [Shewanella sp. 0m-4]